MHFLRLILTVYLNLKIFYVHSVLFISKSDPIRKNVKNFLKKRYEVSASSSLTRGMRYAKRLLADVLLIDYSSFSDDINIENIKQSYLETNSFASIIFLIKEKDLNTIIIDKTEGGSYFYSYDKEIETILYNHNFTNFLEETFRRINLERMYVLLAKSKVNFSLPKDSEFTLPLLLSGESFTIQEFRNQFFQNLDSKDPLFLMTDKKWDSLYLKKSIILYYSRLKRKPDIQFFCLKDYNSNMQKLLLQQITYPRVKTGRKAVYIFLGIEHLSWDLQDKLMKAVKDPDLFQKSSNKIIFISSKNMKQPIESGVLRQDLFYRIKNFELEFPSISDRKEDIQLIADRFFLWYNRITGKKIKLGTSLKVFLTENISDFTYESFYNFLFIGLSIASKSKISLEDFYHIPLRGKVKNPILEKLIKKMHEDFILQKPNEQFETQTLFSLEKNYIEKVLLKNQNNISRTARDLGISRKTLYDRLKKYRIKSS